MRYSNLDFPPYKFLPGKEQHPEKAGGYLHGVEKKVSPVEEETFNQNQFYLYSIDLFNHGYYWESHVWWEALWNEVGRTGPIGDTLKGLIKLAAAMVKFEMNQGDVADDHLNRAKELLNNEAKIGLNKDYLLGLSKLSPDIKIELTL